MLREWFTSLRLRVRALARRRQLDRDLEDELAFHLAMRAEKLGDTGRARRAFGNETWFRETCRELWSLGRVEIWWQDARFALRTLARTPAFTAVAVASLALGIGANVAIFGLVNAVLLKSLPVPDPQELRVINWSASSDWTISSFSGSMHTEGGRSVSGNFPYPWYRNFRDKACCFSDLFAFAPAGRATAIHRGQAFVVDGLLVSDNFFRGLGLRPVMGRTLLPEDERPAATPAVVISHSFWERYSGLDPRVLGEKIRLNGGVFTIVGVLPAGFAGPWTGGQTSDFFVPFSADTLLRSGAPGTTGSARATDPDFWWVEMMGRLAPGSDEAKAHASFDVLFRSLLASQTAAKLTRPEIELARGNAGPLAPRHRLGEMLRLLMALVGLVLLITCANVASLLVARGAARRHELAVRRAIGAGRFRLVRQSFTESLLISGAGGALGFALANLGKSAQLRFLFPSQEPPRFDLATDARVLAFAAGISMITALLFGLAPALRASGTDPLEGLRDSCVHGSSRLRLGKMLVSAQVALSLLLVTGAGLCIRTLVNLWRVDPGFNPESLLVFRVDPSQGGYAEQRLVNYYDAAREAVAALPGVRAVTLSNTLLLSGGMSSGGFTIPGRPMEGGRRAQAYHLRVGDSFLSTMGIPMLVGREFTISDNEGAPKVIVVNQTFARKFFPDESPIGQVIEMGTSRFRIAGVCGDAKYNQLTAAVPQTIYFPFRQNLQSLRGMYFEVRSAIPPEALAGPVRRTLARLDPNIPVTGLSTQTETIARSTGRYSMFAVLCAALGMLALMLSAIGLYGTMAYSVQRRTREIGIRMALGAQPADVARAVEREALLVALAGAAVGLPAAYAAMPLVRAFFFGVEPHDPVTMAAAAGVLVCVSCLAAWVPARRAAMLDPMTVLRRE